MSPNESVNDLVDAAHRLAPVVREHADQAEHERRLPEAVALEFKRAGFYRMCRPKELGGLEADPLTVIRVLEILSRADGAGGWCAMINGAGTIFEGFLGERGGREMFADPNVVSGGVIAPTGRATEVEGGYRVSGRWSIASGAHQCDFLGASCFVFDGPAPRPGPGGMPEWVVPFVSKKDFKIVDTWTVSGLRGTGSHDFEVNDAFVPAHRCIRMPMGPSPYPGRLYAFPFFGFLATVIASTALGVARAAVDELTRVAKTKTPFGMMSSLATRPSAQLAAAEAEVAVRSSRAFLVEVTTDVWDTVVAGRPATVEQRNALRLAATNATTSSARAVDLAYTAGGASAMYGKSLLQRCLRDVHAITQHYAVAPHNHELCGKILLGAEADSPTL
jgi:alkylation response protein AidB-like acyl-CoA dehydrogenase